MSEKGAAVVEHGALLYWVYLAVFASVVAPTAALASSYVLSPQDHVGVHALQAGTCNYTILIETTCNQGASTLDPVSLRFGDAASTDILVHPLTKSIHRAPHVRFPSSDDNYDGPVVLNDMPADPFRECATDVFEVRAQPCVRTPVCYAYLMHRGRDRWRPGRAQVIVEGGDSVDGASRGLYRRQFSSPVFYFRRWMPQNAWFGYEVCGVKAVTKFGAERARNSVITPTRHSHHRK